MGLTYLVFYNKSKTFESITNGNKAPYNNGFIYSTTKTTKTTCQNEFKTDDCQLVTSTYWFSMFTHQVKLSFPDYPNSS